MPRLIRRCLTRPLLVPYRTPQEGFRKKGDPGPESLRLRFFPGPFPLSLRLLSQLPAAPPAKACSPSPKPLSSDAPLPQADTPLFAERREQVKLRVLNKPPDGIIPEFHVMPV